MAPAQVAEPEHSEQPTRAERSRPSLADGRSARLIALLLLPIACRDPSSPPSLRVAGGSPQALKEPTESTRESTASVPDRDLWFSSGPGIDAILARERGDYDAAIRHLDDLLARDDLAVDDRAAAELLRGLEDLRMKRWVEAADRFARARVGEGLRAIEHRIRVMEAQARLDAADPGRALQLVAEIEPEEPVAADWLLVRADARGRTRDIAGARADYERYLADHPNGRRVHEARAKLARLLLPSQIRGEAEQARMLFETVLLQAPLSDYAGEAVGAIEDLNRRLGPARRGKPAREFARSLVLARIDALVLRGRYGEAVREADRFLAERKLPDAERCRALYFRGTAVFKQRRRQDARSSFERAAYVCHKSGKDQLDLTVKSRFQAARGRFAAGGHAAAAKAFEKLASDHPEHSYRDDALVLAGESWAEAGDMTKAADAYHRAMVVGGDMENEARRRLVVMAFSLGDFDRAIEVVDGGLAADKGSIRERSKLHYFRGRALDLLGHREEAVDAWLEAVKLGSLDYPALQALSRLREAGHDVLTKGLGRLPRDPSPPAEHVLPQGSYADRARLLARLGLGESARDELEAGRIGGWPAVLVLHQAGLHSETQRMIASLPEGGFTAPWIRSWQLAHPRPFLSLVSERERAHDVPDLLAYGVMKTESRFDPGAVSWAGARGLIQLMPETAKQVAADAGVPLGAVEALHDPALNLDLGLRYLGGLISRFGRGPGAVALAVPSYNAGPGAVKRWLKDRGTWDLDLFIEAIPYDETRNYTQKVLGRWFAYRWLYGDGAPEERIPYLPLRLPPRAFADEGSIGVPSD